MRIVLFAVVMLLSVPAFADHRPMIDAAGIICLDPASGEQEEVALPNGGSGHGVCPEGQTAFLSYEPEQSPGAEPLHFAPQRRQEQDGVADASSDPE